MYDMSLLCWTMAFLLNGTSVWWTSGQASSYFDFNQPMFCSSWSHSITPSLRRHAGLSMVGRSRWMQQRGNGDNEEKSYK